ncbi:LOW QUALITY PROTEIN: reverse transcriptase [Phytophthora megakarya]|uniref:Reverse transcriptase n=1 Tax=Phytophthora megakarya TaxID=4795 RepID=A0A225W6J7_9STRA|nr:LOW QUALITY PROTEIN: reverse transcriptase [Phytophthora megakarya]
MITAESWDQMCQRVEDLLEACDKWNLLISVTKSFWGYLGHRVAIEGLEANPKDLKSLTDLPFPGSLRSMQSFLCSLNYYSRFIEDYAIYAFVLYELREMEFAELEKRSDLRKIMDQNDPTARDNDPSEPQPAEPAHKAFTTLKTKIATTPILRHFDETRTPVVIVYASDWAISASLMQEHDRIYHPVAFASRTLKTNELNYNVTEKEVLVLLRVLELYYNLLVGCPGPDEAFHAGLAVQVGAITRSFRIMVCAPGSVDSRDHEMHERRRRDTGGDRCQHHAEVKDRRRLNRYHASEGTQTPDPNTVSFDGSARVKRGEGSFSAIVWSLPGWKVAKARSCHLENLTLDEAECNDLLLVLDMLADFDRKHLIRGEIDCKAPGLTLLRWKVLDRLRKWSDHELVHGKRDWNASADSLASAALQRQGGIEVNGGQIIAADYEVDEQNLLFYYPPASRSWDDRDRLLRLVVPETLQLDVLNNYYTMLEGRHQGAVPTRGFEITFIGGDYTGAFRDMWENAWIAKQVKGGPRPKESQETYPFQIIAMNHIPSLPKSNRGNTDLLIRVDLFTGYVIAKASSSRSAQTVAKSYEECVFRRFGASEMMRYDREPGFMYDYFRSERRWRIGLKPTGIGTNDTYSGQGTQDVRARSRSEDWHEYAERLTFAINTVHDRIRGDTPIIWCMGGIRDQRWRPQSQSDVADGAIGTRDGGVIGTNGIISSHGNKLTPECEKTLQIAPVGIMRTLLHTRSRRDLGFGNISTGGERVGSPLAFRAAEKINEFTIKPEIAGTGYQIFPVIHVSKVKLVKNVPDRPRVERTVNESDRLDFDVVLPPEDSWVPDLGADEYEVEWFADERGGKKRRFGRVYRGFFVGYDEPTWVDEADLNCGAIPNAFLRERVNHN